MSTYDVTPLKPLEHVCRVGYDPRPDSYFLYIARPLVTDEKTRKVVGDNDGHVIEWKGTGTREIDSVEELAEKLAPYAVLPKQLYQQLRNDRLQRGPSRAVEPKAKGLAYETAGGKD